VKRDVPQVLAGYFWLPGQLDRKSRIDALVASSCKLRWRPGIEVTTPLAGLGCASRKAPGRTHQPKPGRHNSGVARCPLMTEVV
jgi:hypothetical protein